MAFFSVWTLASLALYFFAALTKASPVILEPPLHETFNSVLQKDIGLRFVKNSGICETTPGVDQISGYIDVGKNMSMVCYTTSKRSSLLLTMMQWFWFFESRNAPEKAPFTLW